MLEFSRLDIFDMACDAYPESGSSGSTESIVSARALFSDEKDMPTSKAATTSIKSGESISDVPSKRGLRDLEASEVITGSVVVIVIVFLVISFPLKALRG